MKTLWCLNGFTVFGVVMNMFVFRWISGSDNFVVPIFLTLVVTLFLSLYSIFVEKSVFGSLAAGSASIGIWATIRGAFPIYCNLMLPFFLLIVVLAGKRMVDNDIAPVPILLSEAIFGFAVLHLVHGIWALEYYAPWIDVHTLFYLASWGVH